MADTLSHQRIVCIYSTSYPYNERWCFSEQRVVEDEMVYIKFDWEASRRFDLTINFFRDLQKVYLFGIMEKVDLFLQELNQLTRLKLLIIEEEEMNLETLNSSSLEKLSLKCLHFSHSRIQLNTPNLSSLVFWNNNHQLNNPPPTVKFCFPLKVRHLECIEFSGNLGQLKNLETLVCNTISFDFRLNQFKSLSRTELWSFDAFRTVQNEKRRLNRTNLQVLAPGFEEATVACETLEVQQQLFCRPFSWFEKESLELSLSFLELAERNQWNWPSHLSGLISWKFFFKDSTFVSFANKIPSVLFDKLRIDRISLLDRNVHETSTLVEVAEKCSVKDFGASLYRLSRDDFERLSRIQSIKRFSGTCDSETANLLFNLKNLETVYMFSSTISIDFICRLFKELNFFSYLYFYSSDSIGLHLDITYHNYRPEHRVSNEIGLTNLYTLAYDDSESTVVSKDSFLKNLDELIEEVKRMKENELIQSFFH